MAQNIILKRSATSGKVPTTSSLNIGELAINTYDGKIFLNRSGSSQTIQEIITTNVTNTGSITLTQTGSFGELVVTKDANLKRDVYVTRDIITNGSLDLLGNITGSSAVLRGNLTVSGSQTTVGNTTIIGNISTNNALLAGNLIVSGSQIVNGDINVLGAVNARQFNIGVISSSIMYTSGSNKFGDTIDDTHQFTGSILVSGSILQNGGALATQDGTILYHNIKWFTPTSTVSTTGTTVTSVGTQFSGGMVGAKLTINGESRIITVVTLNTQVTVNSAYSQNYSGVASGSWGVYSKSLTFDTADNTTRNGGFHILGNDGTQNLGAVYDRIETNLKISDSQNNATFQPSSVNTFALGGDKNIVWYPTAAGNAVNGTRDLGIRRNTTGSLEIFDGITADGAVGNRRDLIARNITGSNAIFSGSVNITGSIYVNGTAVGVAPGPNTYDFNLDPNAAGTVNYIQDSTGNSFVIAKTGSIDIKINNTTFLSVSQSALNITTGSITANYMHLAKYISTAGDLDFNI
jgi:hypothetical protein